MVERKQQRDCGVWWPGEGPVAWARGWYVSVCNGHGWSGAHGASPTGSRRCSKVLPAAQGLGRRLLARCAVGYTPDDGWRWRRGRGRGHGLMEGRERPGRAASGGSRSRRSGRASRRLRPGRAFRRRQPRHCPPVRPSSALSGVNPLPLPIHQRRPKLHPVNLDDGPSADLRYLHNIICCAALRLLLAMSGGQLVSAGTGRRPLLAHTSP